MPLAWNPALNDLIRLLASLYEDRGKARFAVRQSELDPAEVDFSGVPKIFWLRIVEEAHRRGVVDSLIKVAEAEFHNVDFTALRTQLASSTVPDIKAPDLPDTDWKRGPTDAGTLEKITGAQPTFLPIRFLEIGLQRARSVACVTLPNGTGSAFLVNKNLLVTNHHVIPNASVAQQAKIWFNYQKTVDGTDAQVDEYTLDPNDFFATSPLNGGDDWTVVRVKGNANAAWGALDLANITVQADDFVNIVQHPGGMRKQIAIYHNVVAYADATRVQYLTDTMPGSSGSPVFDSDWNVVALHHSGGWIPEPGNKKVYFRNEGISVRVLAEALKDHLS